MDNLFMFDVEATSLHGTGFAVGAVVISKKGEVLDKFELLCISEIPNCCEWVQENVLPYLTDMPQCNEMSALKEEFYSFYMKWKSSCEIWGDCCFPVETNFLSAVANDDLTDREYKMPYPLYDLGTILNVEVDRNDYADRLIGTTRRKHNPFYDSLDSAVSLLRFRYRMSRKIEKNGIIL